MSRKTFNIKDGTRIKDHINKLIEDKVAVAPELVDLVFDDMAMDVQTRSKIYLTNNMSVITGLLRSSITTEHEFLKKKIGTNVEYAPHVEFGTSPHMINSPVLIKTPNDRNGKWRYIKMHNGSKEKPYLRPAFNEVKNNFSTYIKPYFE